jgi:hypothetical protein
MEKNKKSEGIGANGEWKGQNCMCVCVSLPKGQIEQPQQQKTGKNGGREKRGKKR